MRTLNVGLTPEQIAKRGNRIGGSDATIIMSGDDMKIHRLWQEKTGKIERENLDGVLPVVFGQFTEPLNLYWFEQQTGREVTDDGKELADASAPWRTCTLDGLTDGGATVFEAKCVNAFSKEDEVLQKYWPQLSHNMAVCGLENAVLSVFIGTMKWIYRDVVADPFYADLLMEAEAAFWQAMQADVPPKALPTIAAPIPQSEWRTVDLAGSNEWSSFANDWLDNKSAAAKFKKAGDGLKKLVEADVGMVTGPHVQAKRTKAGAIKFSEVTS